MTMGRPRPGVTKNCEGCGSSFYLSKCLEKRGDKCCSLACRDKVKRAKTYNDDAREKKCATCSEWKPFDCFTATHGEKAAKTGISLQAKAVMKPGDKPEQPHCALGAFVNSSNIERTKRDGWINDGILVISADDTALRPIEAQIIKSIGNRIHGRSKIHG